VKSNSIFKNSTFLIVGNLLQKVISFYTAILITRYLGPERYGQYTFVISLILIVAVLWNFGFGTIIVRDVSKDKSLAAKYSGGVIFLKFFFAAIIILLSCLYLKIVNYDNVIIKAILIFGVGNFLMSINEVFISIFSAYRRMDFSAFIPIIRASVLLLAIVVIIQTEGGIIEIFLGYLISFIFVLIFSSCLIKTKFAFPVFNFNIQFLKELVIKAFPLLLISVVNIILFRIDAIMLSKMQGDVELGLYGAAYNIFEISIALFPMILMKATFPVISEQFDKNIENMKKLFVILMKYFYLLGIPLSLGTILLGKDIIIVLFGNEYINAGILLSLLGGSIWIFFLSNLLSWTLTAIYKQNYVLLSNFIVMIINIILNFIFIPLYGAKAAALTTLFCELVQLIFLFIVFKRNINMKFNIKIFKIIFSTIIMSSFLFTLKRLLSFPNLIIELIIIVVLSIGIYLLVISLLKVTNKNEFKLFFKN
jgi:O-antigen/teichoic acid export membrane protein